MPSEIGRVNEPLDFKPETRANDICILLTKTDMNFTSGMAAPIELADHDHCASNLDCVITGTMTVM
jgi:hypothetical protein